MQANSSPRRSQVFNASQTFNAGASQSLIVPTPSTRRLTSYGGGAPSARSQVGAAHGGLEFIVPESYITNFDVYTSRVCELDNAWQESLRSKQTRQAKKTGSNPFSFFVCPNTPIDLDLGTCVATMCDIVLLIYNKLYDKACMRPALLTSIKKVDGLIMDRILKGLHALLTTTAKAVADA